MLPEQHHQEVKVKVHEHAFRSLGVSYRPQREELSNISPPQYKNTYVLISRRLEGYKPSIITNTARSASPGKSSTPIDACKNTVSGVEESHTKHKGGNYQIFPHLNIKLAMF